MATTIKLSNVQQMVGHLLTIGTACTFISCVTATPQDKYLKKDCPFKNKGLVKVAKRTGWLNMDYNKAVRRRIAKHFEVEVSQVQYTNGESWHKHLLTEEGKATPVVVNKNKYDESKPEENLFYLFLTQKSSSPEKSRYLLPNGQEVPYEEIKPFFYARGGKDEFKPEVRCVTLNHVSELRVRGLIVKTNGQKNDLLPA